MVTKMLLSSKLLLKLKEIASYALLVLTLYIIVVISLVNWNYMPDDGYRYLHVVSNLVEGLGVRWNAVDAEPSQSFTSFPWILSLVGLAKITSIELIDLSKYTGLTCFCISIIILFEYVIRQSKDRIISSVFLALAFVLSPVVYFHTVNGMETMLFFLSITCALVCFSLTIYDKKFLTATFLAFLITVLVRYEAVIFCGFLTLYLMYQYKNKPLFFFWRFFIFLIFPGLTYFALVYLYFGNLLPNSFYVKTSVTFLSTSGYRYFIENYSNFFLGCSIAFLVAYPFSKDSNKKAYFAIFLALHLQLLFILRIIPTVGQGGRFMFPYLVPLYIVTINLTLRTILETYSKQDITNKLISLSLVFLLIFSTYSGERKSSFKKLIAYSAERVMDPSIGKAFAQMSPLNPSDISIVGGESGAISYFSKFTFVDIWGLHDSFIARNGLDTDYIFSYQPDIFVSFIETDTLIFDNQGVFENLNTEIMLSKIKGIERAKNVKGNTAYFSYLVMTDERFKQMKFKRMINIGSGKSWVFFINENSPFSTKLAKAVNELDWEMDKNSIVASMKPRKLLGALINPFNRQNYTRVKVMFDD